jgi:predicted nuclease of predicted toxin-antitoxin system
MKFLIDMNLSPRWVDLLVHSGLDAVHWSTVGPVDASDREIMSFAAQGDYVVLTHDLDFGVILATTNGMKPSVVQLRSDDISPAAIGAKVVAALRQMNPELTEGALVSVDPKGTRLRVLPLQRVLGGPEA